MYMATMFLLAEGLIMSVLMLSLVFTSKGVYALFMLPLIPLAVAFPFITPRGEGEPPNKYTTALAVVAVLLVNILPWLSLPASIAIVAMHGSFIYKSKKNPVHVSCKCIPFVLFMISYLWHDADMMSPLGIPVRCTFTSTVLFTLLEPEYMASLIASTAMLWAPRINTYRCPLLIHDAIRRINVAFMVIHACWIWYEVDSAMSRIEFFTVTRQDLENNQYISHIGINVFYAVATLVDIAFSCITLGYMHRFVLECSVLNKVRVDKFAEWVKRGKRSNPHQQSQPQRSPSPEPAPEPQAAGHNDNTRQRSVTPGFLAIADPQGRWRDQVARKRELNESIPEDMMPTEDAQAIKPALDMLRTAAGRAASKIEVLSTVAGRVMGKIATSKPVPEPQPEPQPEVQEQASVLGKRSNDDVPTQQNKRIRVLRPSTPELKSTGRVVSLVSGRAAKP